VGGAQGLLGDEMLSEKVKGPSEKAVGCEEIQEEEGEVLRGGNPLSARL